MANLQSYLLFSLFLAANLLVNMDHGSIPAATTEISAHFSLSKSELGGLGTQVFLGTTIGGLTSGFIYRHVSAKWIQCISMALVCGFMLSFPYTSSSLVFIWRFLTGFCQSFITVYYTVWIDVFSPKSASTIWMTLLQVSAPIGIILGYVLTALMSEIWAYSFYLQGILYLPCSLLLLLFPNRMVTCKDKKDALMEENEEGIWACFKGLISNSVYICSFLCLSTLFFSVSGVQFWASNYLETVIEIPNELLVPVYTIVAFSAPTLGVLFGGFLCHRYGGYRDKRAPGICLIFLLIAMMSNAYSPWTRNWCIFAVSIWITFFFGGAIVPVLTGVMVHSLPNKLKQLGVPIATILANCLGYLPAPWVYGVVSDLTGDKSKGMLFTLYWSYLGFFLLLPIYYKVKNSQ